MEENKRMSVTLKGEVYEWLRNRAKSNNRSISGEISNLLKKEKETSEIQKQKVA